MNIHYAALAAACTTMVTTAAVFGDPTVRGTLFHAAEAVSRYDQHITTLGNPFFEGRAPGTNGNRVAADYIEFHFREWGLEPAFTGDTGPTYRQPFSVGEEAGAKTQFAQYTTPGASASLRPDVDFRVIDYSGNGAGSGPLAFAGYSIEDGSGGYRSYTAPGSLAGKIAMVLRFEPMDQNGRSRWTGGPGWSPAAALELKLKAAAAQGAAGIILVNPPQADDERTHYLAGVGDFTPMSGVLNIPVVMMTADAADALVRSANPGLSLASLVEAANEKGGVIDLPEAKVLLAAEIQRSPIWTDNVGGIVRGKGDLADEYVVIGAHYDHVGYGKFGSRAGERGMGVIHPGADDNASGTSGMLLLAERLSAEYDKLPQDAQARSLLFIGFSAEEMGLVGSRHYCRNFQIPKDKHYAMLNMDMIGRLTGNKLEVHGTGTADGFDALIEPFFAASGLSIEKSPGGTGPSDHASFYRAGIPVLFFFTGLHEQYHMPEDVSALINREGAVTIAEMVGQIALALATRAEPLTFTSTDRGGAASASPGPTRLKVRFGIMPGDYSGSVKGILVDGVSEGTSAAEAGLQAGDIIIKWNGQELTSVEAWMPILAAHNPGDKVELVFVRDGKEMTGSCELKPARRGG